MAKKTITALMVAPDMEPCVVKLPNIKGYLQQAVSVGMDEVYPIEILKLNPSIAIFHLRNAPIGWARCNRRIGSQILMGVFYVVAVDDGKLRSLSAEELECYKAMFWEPESFTDEDAIDAFLGRLCSD